MSLLNYAKIRKTSNRNSSTSEAKKCYQNNFSKQEIENNPSDAPLIFTEEHNIKLSEILSSSIQVDKPSMATELNFVKFISDYLKYYDNTDTSKNFENFQQVSSDFDLKREYQRVVKELIIQNNEMKCIESRNEKNILKLEKQKQEMQMQTKLIISQQEEIKSLKEYIEQLEEKNNSIQKILIEEQNDRFNSLVTNTKYSNTNQMKNKTLFSQHDNNTGAVSFQSKQNKPIKTNNRLFLRNFSIPNANIDASS